MEVIADILNRITVLEEQVAGQKKLLTSEEAAAYLHISLKHLYRLCYNKKIPSHNPSGRTLYFLKSELDKWIEDSSVNRKKRKPAKV